VSIVQEAGWAPGPVWTGAENIAQTGIRSPDRPARSQSLYRLRYPAHRRQGTDLKRIYSGAGLTPTLEFHVSARLSLQIVEKMFKSLTLGLLMSYIYGAPILDVSRSHTTTQHSR